MYGVNGWIQVNYFFEHYKASLCTPGVLFVLLEMKIIFFPKSKTSKLRRLSMGPTSFYQDWIKDVKLLVVHVKEIVGITIFQ